MSDIPTVSGPDYPMGEGSSSLPVIKGYKIIKQLGEGGMGIVYLAEQTEPIKRQVALKIVKPGMDSREVIARFQAERQALAMLDHPNVAHVYDAGTTENGRPYFVMEYIHGIPITDYCDQQELSIEDRLELFKQVCEGVQHAHQRGIIHRDLKPSNILIISEDGKATPKVIDFGIAKAIKQELTEKTLFTAQGQLIGTPEYMSPEQADLISLNVDTRTDVYSLGVVLYQLLTGTLPFDPNTLRSAAFGEIQRIIREVDPPKPSIKLSSLGAEAKEVARTRKIALGTLTKKLHKELEWIPLKAIRKERTDRYQSATDMAKDVQNYLDGNPLVAGPESAIYKFKKFIRKRKGFVAAVGSVVTILIVGFIVSTTLYFQTKRAAEETRESLYINKIALIYSEYKSANTANVKRLLEECPQDLRNWEYNYLNKLSDQPILTLKGHKRGVSSLVFTPDYTTLVSASVGDNLVRMWDLVTGKELKTFPLDPTVTRIAISPNGKQVATVKDTAIEMWDIENKLLIKTFVGHTHGISCIVFSKDGNRIASSDIDYKEHDLTIKIWDINSATEISSFQHTGEGIACMDFNPSGTRLVSKSHAGSSSRYELRLWDINTGELIREVSNGQDLGVSHFWDVMFDNTGKYVLTANWGQAWVWDADTLQILRGAPNAHNSGSRRAIFSSDSKCFVTGGIFGDLKVWNNQNGGLQRTLLGHTNTIQSLAFGPYGSLLASGSFDGTIKIWNIAVDPEKYKIGNAHPNAPVQSVSYNPQGTLLASGGSDKLITIWRTDTWKRIRTLSGHSDNVMSVFFSPDGKRLVSGSKDTSIRIWDMENDPPTVLHILKGHSDSVNSVKFSPSGKYIISGSSDRTIKIWQADSGDLINTLSHEAAVNSVLYTFDGKQIISGSNDNTVRIWEVKSGKCLKILEGEHKNGINCVGLSPDGNTIASGDTVGRLIIWNKKGEIKVSPASNHLGAITDIVFSPDSKRIFTSSNDASIRVWKADKGDCLLTPLNELSGGVNGLSLSPNGETLVAGANYFGDMYVISSYKQKDDMKKEISEAYFRYNLTLATKELKQNPHKIPSRANSFNNHHYLLFMEPMNWKDAKEYAESIGAHLATITTKEENDWTTQTFPADMESYWLGGFQNLNSPSYAEPTGGWEWITGEEWGYNNWGPGKPNSRRGNQHGLQVKPGDQWDDDNMASKKYFLIEWNQ